MSTIHEWTMTIWSDTWLAALLYWLPLGFCALGYIARTASNFAKDRKERVRPGAFYRPTDTMGSLIGRAVVSVLPIGNLLAAIFDLSPEVFGKFFEWLRAVFDQPLVPDLPDGQELRSARQAEREARR